MKQNVTAAKCGDCGDAIVFINGTEYSIYAVCKKDW